MILNQAAWKHSEWQAKHKKLSHFEGFIGPGLEKRIENEGYEAGRAAENVAWGKDTAEETFNEWLGSPGHKANMLGEYEEFGIAGVDKYWTAVFATKL